MLRRISLLFSALMINSFFVLLAAAPAQAELIGGYLAECTAVAAGSCTETTGTGYARQPISWGDAVNGVSVTVMPYTFGGSAPGVISGHAVYDAPTGGNLVAVIPLATAITSPPVDQSDIGGLKLTITALASYRDPRLYSGTAAAGSALGTTADGSTVTAGVKDVFRLGMLTAALPSFDASYNGPLTETTGFAITNLTSQATLAITGAGALATGAVTMPSAPIDGQSFRLSCGVTVTALTMSAPSGFALVGSPTTCGPSAGHEWFYIGGTAKTWYPMF